MAVMGISSLILVAMVVAVAVGVSRKQGGHDSESTEHSGQIQTSSKAVTQICQPTDYKQACVDSLSEAAEKNTTDPKELIQIAFKATIGKVTKAFNESELLKEAAKDPRTSKALDNCKELMNYSLDDLRAAIRSLGVFDISKLDELIDDIMTWLSGSLTYQETCIDGFEGTEGDTSEKMKKALEGAHELTSNLLAIINEISSVLSSFDLPFLNRRLLSEETPEEMEIPAWVTPERRSLMEKSIDSLKPNVTVAKDGSGQYKTINEALAAVPKKKNETFVIYIKEGVYEEYVLIEKSMWFLVMIGDGATKTVIKGNRNFIDGTPTFKTATVGMNNSQFPHLSDINFGAKAQRKLRLGLGHIRKIQLHNFCS
ncbi:hypothetical protein MRB53_029069 [Persea americana]|uniref:Uncharacterized protein n=1 Tax=Persea americana TaxID=3435 RepID=A0ACC2KHB0_PERAE|nr:hypothetical protein MRB53_029069 [Persea americana]